ncbi:MAG: M28 family peptidase [Deltaproteobacteria bacterium]|nr:M28 family peptidase [Deltaproteobacteria bacterium]
MKPDRRLIRSVLSLPTAPFHEEAVAAFVKSFAKKLRLRWRQDRYGNLKIVYKKGKGNSPFALTAHMDHPGFEVVRGGRRPIVRLLGGVPDQYFGKARVMVWNDGVVAKGKAAKRLDKKKRRFVLRLKQPVRRGAFGTFALPAVRFRGSNIYTKAADDVINVALLLNFLQGLVRGRNKAHVIFLFTRAEEVGFVGALGVAKRKWIRKEIPIIVLEASSAKAGKVKIGGGPVLRVGDKASTFSHAVDLWLQAAAQDIPHQRALLPGGRCEATVFTQKEYRAGCLALPLGNYHNTGPKNYAPEFVSLKDYRNMLGWLMALTQTASPQKIRKGKLKELDRIFQKLNRRLKRNSKG